MKLSYSSISLYDTCPAKWDKHYNKGYRSPMLSSALFFGGQPGNQDITEYFNGSSWAETADLNTGRLRVGSAGTSAPASLAYGGGPPYQNVVELWNGTSWSEQNNLNTAK